MESARLQDYFTLPWTKTGFTLGLHLKGKGQLAIHLTRENTYLRDSTQNPILYELVIDFSGKKLDFKNFVENNFVSKLVPSGLPLNEKTPSAYWFEMRCSKRSQRNTRRDRYSCSLSFGKSGYSEALIEIYIGNPFKELHTRPTYVSFFPQTKDTLIKAAFECSMTYDDVCSHTGECKTINEGLICSSRSTYHNALGINGIRTFEEDRCICRDAMKWISESKQCVRK